MQTIAGRTLVTQGGPATNSMLRYPVAAAVDSANNLYIADQDDNRVFKVDTTGLITTFAGTGMPGFSGDTGSAVTALLNAPNSLAIDANNIVYISDSGNNRIRKVTTDGVINTIAGSGSSNYNGDGAALKAALSPVAIALDKTASNLYISEGARVRVVNLSTGALTTLTGNGTPGYTGDFGSAAGAKIGFVASLAADAQGNLYLSDYDYCAIRRIETGTLRLIKLFGGGTCGYSGDGASATSAAMVPWAVVVDPSGGLYLSEPFASTVRRIDFTSGKITVVAGQAGQYGYAGDGATAFSMILNFPYGLAIDSTRKLYVCDLYNYRVRQITAAGAVSTIAGSSVRDGQGVNAFLDHPVAISLDSKGNLNIADAGDSLVRQLNLSTGLVTSLQAYPLSPQGVVSDSAGNFYATSKDWYLYKFAANGQISQVAGNGNNGYSGDNSQASSAMLGDITALAVDSANNIYLADDQNFRIRKIDQTLTITTVAGSGSQGYSGDGAPALSAGMDPYDIAVDKNGAIYVADTMNNRIRKFTPGGSISTFAGTGTSGNSGDGGPANKASLNYPTGVGVDKNGNVFICDFGNGLLREVTPDGNIRTIAGDGTIYPFTGDGLATKQNVSPYRVTVDNNGNIYVSDWANDRVRKLTAINIASLATVSGDQQTGNAGTTLAQDLVVKLLGSDGNPFAGATVAFAVASGSATVSPATALTATDGTASTAVTLGATAGAVTVTATVGALTPVTFSLTATPNNNPQIFAGGVVSAGLSVPTIQVASPNAIVSIFGQNFAPAGTSRKVSGGDLVNGLVPANLIGVCAVFGTQRAPIFLVTPGQLNVQVPQVAGSGTVGVQVITNCDLPNQAVSNTVDVAVAPAAPEFFYAQNNANGTNPVAATDGVTLAGVGDPARLGPGFALAVPGETVTIYATGFGASNPAYTAGQLPPVGAGVSGVTVQIDGKDVAATAIQYVGVAPLNAGLYQLNLVAPTGLTPGDHTLAVTIGGASSPAGAYLSVGGIPILITGEARQ